MIKSHGIGIYPFKKKVWFSVQMSLGQVLDLIPFTCALLTLILHQTFIEYQLRARHTLLGTMNSELSKAQSLLQELIVQTNIPLGVTVLPIKPYTFLIVSNHASYSTDRER